MFVAAGARRRCLRRSCLGIDDAFNGSIAPIAATMRARDDRRLLAQGCPVGLEDLRLIALYPTGFRREDHTASSSPTAAWRGATLPVFRRLYGDGFPIRRMEPIDNYGGSDSVDRGRQHVGVQLPLCGRNDPLVGACLRPAIDVNPIENPYVTRAGTTSHTASGPFLRPVEAPPRDGHRGPGPLLSRSTAWTGAGVAHGAARRTTSTSPPQVAERQARGGWSSEAGGGNRTLVISLEGWGSTIELHPRTHIEAVQPDRRRSTFTAMALMPGTTPRSHLDRRRCGRSRRRAFRDAGAAPSARALHACSPARRRFRPETTHGLAHHLRQYPDVSLANAGAATRRGRRCCAARATHRRGWRNIERRRDARLRHPSRAPAPRVTTRSATSTREHRRNSADRHDLDPSAPGVARSTRPSPDESRGSSASCSASHAACSARRPAAALTRWHSHIVCVQGHQARAHAPTRRHAVPQGAKKAQGSEMLHLWFTQDLRSAFAVHAAGARALP